MAIKQLMAFCTLIILLCSLPFNAVAENAPPTTIGAPDHSGELYGWGDGLALTVSILEDVSP